MSNLNLISWSNLFFQNNDCNVILRVDKLKDWMRIGMISYQLERVACKSLMFPEDTIIPNVSIQFVQITFMPLLMYNYSRCLNKFFPFVDFALAMITNNHSINTVLGTIPCDTLGEGKPPNTNAMGSGENKFFTDQCPPTATPLHISSIANQSCYPWL